MDRVKLDLIQKALRHHKKIYPCGSRSSLGECFTVHGGRMTLWYNTEDGSTHVMTRPVPEDTPPLTNRHITWATVFPAEQPEDNAAGREERADG